GAAPGFLDPELVDGDRGVDDAVLQQRHHADLEHRRPVAALLRLQPAQNTTHLSVTVDAHLACAPALQRLLLPCQLAVARFGAGFHPRPALTTDALAVVLE